MLSTPTEPLIVPLLLSVVIVPELDTPTPLAPGAPPGPPSKPPAPPLIVPLLLSIVILPEFETPAPP